MLRSATTGPFQGVISVASWLKILSAGAVAEYYFTSYNSILSHLAMDLLIDEDFPRTDEELSDQDDDDEMNPANELAYEHLS